MHSLDTTPAPQAWVEESCPLLPLPSPHPWSHPHALPSGGSPSDGAWSEEKVGQKVGKVERAAHSSSQPAVPTLRRVLCGWPLVYLGLGFPFLLDNCDALLFTLLPVRLFIGFSLNRLLSYKEKICPATSGINVDGVLLVLKVAFILPSQSCSVWPD